MTIFPYMQGFSALDLHFARFIAKISGDRNNEAFLAAALVSRSTSEGNICLDLKEFAGGKVFTGGGEEFRLPPFNEWQRILAGNSAVGKPGDFRPLILDDKGRLYLYRYWDYEKALADFILGRAKIVEESGNGPPAAFAAIKEKLDLFFPAETGGGRDWQKLAAALSLFKSFTVISGSPGTGKTTTAARIIALLLEAAGGRKLTVALSAPTGKAAVRLQEAITKAKETLPCSDATREAIPEKAGTVHRLLGYRPGSPYFRHRRDNPLPADIVVVDEASMLDLPLMSKLVQALPARAKLILLGDKDQLTSVEAGAVLGDICGNGRMDVFSQGFIAGLEKAAGAAWRGALQPGGSAIDDCLVQLKKNYRFGEKSGVGRLSAAVNDGDGPGAVEILKSGVFSDVGWSKGGPEGFPSFLRKWVREGFGDYLTAVFKGDPAKAFDYFDGFRVLCPLRRGPWGIEVVNAVIEGMLAEEGLIRPAARWYPGRPVMILRNDYRQRLFNGDVGIIMPEGGTMFGLRAFFRDASGTIRTFLPARLPEHETVYAMTVHKSQGSEFDRVLFILPDQDAALLTRELIYTGITRARRFVQIWSGEEIFRSAVSRTIARRSGLGDLLRPRQT